MGEPNTAQLLTDIAQRLDAIGERVSEQNIRNIVETYLSSLSDDDPIVRKMRFGRSEPQLLGTKYARYGLTVADVEFMYDVLNSAQRVGISRRGPSEELRNTFNAISEALYYSDDEVRQMGLRELDEEFPRIPKIAFHGADRALAERGLYHLTEAYQNAVRAMDTAESGYGQQLVGAQYVSDLWEAARRESRVFSLIDTFPMAAPTVYMPVEVDFPEMLYVSESTTTSSSNYGTSKTGSNRTAVTAKKFVIHQMWSGEMEEDSIIPYVPFLRRQAQLSLAFYSDSLVLNGDTTDPNGINDADTDVTDTKHYLAFDGIRHAGLVDNTGNSANAAGATVSRSLFVPIYGRMVDSTYKHDWGHPNNPTDVVHVVDIYTGDALMDLDEVLTVDKYGQNATLLTGEITRMYGRPVIPSIALPKTNSAGKIDADTSGNNLYGQIATFNRRGLKVGWRRQVKVETERLPATDQNRIVYSLRMGLGRFSPTGATSGIEWADVVYGIGL